MHKDLSKLIELDKSLQESVRNKEFIHDKPGIKLFFARIDEFFKLRKKIKTEFAKSVSVKIDDREEKRILRQIKSGEPFFADKVVRILYPEENNDDYDKLEWDEVQELSWEVLFNWFGPYEYVEDLIEIGVLTIGVKIPDHLSQFVEEARRCYAFQQYNAVNALSRTILEIAMRDILQRRGKRKSKPSELIKLVSKDDEQKERLEKIYGQLSKIVHGNKTIRSKDIKISLKETLEIVEELYDQNLH